MVERAHPDLREVGDRALWLRGYWSLSRAAGHVVSLATVVAADLTVFALALSVAIEFRVSILPGLSRVFPRPTSPLAHLH